MAWTIIKGFPDWGAARAFAIHLIASAGDAPCQPDQVEWQVVWQPTGLHIAKVEEHPSGIGIIYYRNGDADVYQEQLLNTF